MAAPSIVFQDLVSFAELKSLASATGPCITIATPLPNPLEIHTRLKNAVHSIENMLPASDQDREVGDLLEPIRKAAESIEIQGIWAKGVMVLRSRDQFLGYWLRDWRTPLAEVDNRFHIRPLLALAAREQRFYLLALSQKHLRLFHATMSRSEVKELPHALRNMRVWMETNQPDHVLDNRSAAGPSTGSMKGVRFGTGSDREKHQEYLKHFFKEVDRNVRTAIDGEPAPLVLAGVEEEAAIYRRVQTYPHVFEQDVHGSPDGLREPELMEHVRELVSRSPSEPLRKALADVERRPVSANVKEIAEMAPEGRIEDLLIEREIEDRSLETAALEVLRHGGRAFAVTQEEMPRDAPAVALLRY